MLRTSARSVRSSYRRLWSASIGNAPAVSSSCNWRGQGRGLGRDYVPSRNEHSEGSLGYINSFTDWKSPRAQYSELETSSVQQQYDNENMRGIMNDEELSRIGRAGIGLKSIGSSFSTDLVSQGRTRSSSVTSMFDENPNQHSNFSQRRPVLISCNHSVSELATYTTPSRSMMMMVGSSLPCIGRSVCPFHHWRLATSKAGDAADEGDRRSSEEGEGRGPEDDEKSASRTLEDFQHEEIVGPTVERDLSDTADQVRESLTELRSYMDSFGIGFVILGTVQLVTAIWGSLTMEADGIWLWRELPFVFMSYTFGYLLRNTGSAMDFFTRMEGRSRIRLLTLSLQVIKFLSQFFHRSGVMVKFVAFTSFLALIRQTIPFS